MAKDLIDDLKEQIAWMQDYERYGGRMTPPRAYEILCVLESARDLLLEMQAQNDILEAALTAERRSHDANRQNRL